MSLRWAQAQELEGRIHKLLSGGADPFSSSVRELRNTLSTKYQDIILEDGAFAEEKIVENLLWRLYYSQIEEFRSRIRKLASHAVPNSGEGGPKAEQALRREKLRKLVVSFRSFLSEASNFYHELMRKLKARQGLPPDYSFVTAEFDSSDATKATERTRCAMLCQRCCICLGDFARYKELHTNGDASSRDWTVAAGYYMQAAGIWPSGGNPHNQLAVLSTYSDNEVVAVYRYFRSLAVEVPFLTARDNLILQFEKNRHKYAQLPPALPPLPASQNGVKKVALNGRAGGSKSKEVQAADAAQIAARRTSFRIRFVRLVGIIFTKISLETFEDALSGAMIDLDALLAGQNKPLETEGPEFLLQVAAILIFTIENVRWVPEKHQPSYAEISKNSEVLQMGHAAAFEVMGRLMRKCTEAEDNITHSHLLSPLLPFLEWMLHSPEGWKSADIRGKQGASRLFFWRQTVGLLDALLDAVGEDVWVGIVGQTGKGGVKGAAIWEDFELRGFVPLAPAHKQLTFSGGNTGHSEAKQRDERVCRLLAAGKGLAEHKVLKELKVDVALGVFFRPGDPIPSVSPHQAQRVGPPPASSPQPPTTLEPGLIAWPVGKMPLKQKLNGGMGAGREGVSLIDALGTDLGEGPGYQLQGPQVGVGGLEEAGELDDDVEEEEEESGALPEWMAPALEEIEKEVSGDVEVEKRKQARQEELEAMRLANHRGAAQPLQHTVGHTPSRLGARLGEEEEVILFKPSHQNAPLGQSRAAAPEWGGGEAKLGHGYGHVNGMTNGGHFTPSLPEDIGSGGARNSMGIHVSDTHAGVTDNLGGVHSDAYRMGAGGLDWATLNTLLGYNSHSQVTPPSKVDTAPISARQYPTLGELASMYNGGGPTPPPSDWVSVGSLLGEREVGMEPAGGVGNLVGSNPGGVQNGVWGFGSTQSPAAPVNGHPWIGGVGPPGDYSWLDEHSHVKPHDLGTTLWGTGGVGGWDPAGDPTLGGGGMGGGEGWVTSPGRAPGSLLAFESGGRGGVGARSPLGGAEVP